jgi:hypothetical protein
MPPSSLSSFNHPVHICWEQKLRSSSLCILLSFCFCFFLCLRLKYSSQHIIPSVFFVSSFLELCIASDTWLAQCWMHSYVRYVNSSQTLSTVCMKRTVHFVVVSFSLEAKRVTGLCSALLNSETARPGNFGWPHFDGKWNPLIRFLRNVDVFRTEQTEQWTQFSDDAARCMMPLLHIQEVLGSILCLHATYPDCFSWFSSVEPGK